MGQMTARLELDDVSKRYEEGPAGPLVLRGISARFEPGDYTVIIGRSGSGKSTLLNLLGGLDVPTAGEVRFNGQSLSGMPETRRSLVRRREMGFVFQSFNLIPTLTVLENLLVPLQLNGLTWKAGAARGRMLLREAGLGGCAERFPEELSGGEQQRAAIVRSIVHEPTVVIADEPTGNLDLETARDTLDLLERFCRNQGHTLIMATHSREVMGRATSVMRIRGGNLESVESGDFGQ